MLSQQVKIINQLGLHARASMKLMTLANTFNSDIKITYNGHEANAKSIMNLMLLAASCGAQIEIQAHGEDETQAVQEIVELINNRFGESQ